MSAPNPRLATSADVMQRSKMGMVVAPASSGGRAQIHQIWTVANVPDLDLAANHNGSSARVLLGLRITESSGADDIAHFELPALLPRWWPSTRSEHSEPVRLRTDKPNGHLFNFFASP